MAEPLKFDFELGPEDPGHRDPQDPMRILVLGDFSGRGYAETSESQKPLAERPIASIDRDNFEDVMARLAPRVDLPFGNTLEFKNIDDFHPDQLYSKLNLFQELRDTRKRLSDPSTFTTTADSLQMKADEGRGSSTPEDRQKTSDKPAGGDSLLDQLVEQTTAGPGAAVASASQVRTQEDISELVRQIVAPYVVPSADPRQAEYIDSVDQATSDLMRAVLHHPSFQIMEAAWRSLERLVRGLETGTELKLYVLDVTKQELATDIHSAADDLIESSLYRRLVEQGVQTPGGKPWSLLIGNYTFGRDADGHELAVLAALGAIASRSGGAFLAAADPAIVGCRSVVEFPDPSDWHRSNEDRFELWQRLRGSSVASSIGLALPRILLRLPYGTQTRAIDRFEFEELGSSRDHASYLWGNSAFECGLLIGRAFTDRGWSMEPGDVFEIDDLPAHIYEDAGEMQMQACAESFLSERAGEAILKQGIMPFLSYRNNNAVRIMRFQSIAKSPSSLAGAWGSD